MTPSPNHWPRETNLSSSNPHIVSLLYLYRSPIAARHPHPTCMVPCTENPGIPVQVQQSDFTHGKPILSSVRSFNPQASPEASWTVVLLISLLYFPMPLYSPARCITAVLSQITRSPGSCHSTDNKNWGCVAWDKSVSMSSVPSGSGTRSRALSDPSSSFPPCSCSCSCSYSR